MANIVNLDRVSKGYGAAGPLLTDVSLGLDDADRIGVVGLNGAGKSTLLRLLTRAEEPDAGRVTHRRDLRVAALPQNLTLDRRRDRTRRGARHRLARRGHGRRARVGRRRRECAPSSTGSACRTSGSTSRSARCPAASGAGSRWPRCWCARRTC